MDHEKIKEMNTMMISGLINDRYTLMFLKRIFPELQALNFNSTFSNAEMFVNDLRPYDERLKTPLAWYIFTTNQHEKLHLLVGDTDQEIVKNIILDSDLMKDAKVLVIETYHEDDKQRSYNEASDQVRYILLPLLFQKAMDKLKNTRDITSLNYDELFAYCLYEPQEVHNELLGQDNDLKDICTIVEKMRKSHQECVKGLDNDESNA